MVAHMTEPEVQNFKATHRYADDRPGQYVCSYSFDYRGAPYVLNHECNNPENGRRVLEARYASIIDPPTQAKRKRAA
jgi:hypothetical protein